MQIENFRNSISISASQSSEDHFTHCISNNKEKEVDSSSNNKKKIDRECDYLKRRLLPRPLPEVYYPLVGGDKTTLESISYVDPIKGNMSLNSSENTLENSNMKFVHHQNLSELVNNFHDGSTTKSSTLCCEKRTRWGESVVSNPSTTKINSLTPVSSDSFRDSMSGFVTPPSESVLNKKFLKNRWDETPKTNHWDATPGVFSAISNQTNKTKSRWDTTPKDSLAMFNTPKICNPTFASTTPMGEIGADTPMQYTTDIPMTPDQYHDVKMERELWLRNKPLTDDELDSMLPKEGYLIVPAPMNYEPIRTPARKLKSTPLLGVTPMYQIPETDMHTQPHDLGLLPDGLPDIKPEDQQFFSKLVNVVDEKELTISQVKERRILKLLLKIKNGTASQRKSALKQVTDKARELGSQALFDQILPILMSPTTEDQARHLMVKVIDRVLYRLQELVRPYVHKILIVVMPMLIDEDYFARVEGREIISNLAKAAGQAAMISALRPDIDNADEYVRNTAARAFSVVCSAFGIQTMFPFFKAVTKSKKSWQF
jgi:splicing factor 3B subunit 1